MEENTDPPMIVRSTRAGGFVRLNRSFLAKVGFSEAELARKPLIDWVEADDRQIFLSALEGGDENCLVRHRTSDGGSLLLDLRMQDQGEDPVVLGRCVESLTATAPRAEADVGVTDSLRRSLHKIAMIVEEQNPGYRCSILLVADGRFVKGAGPSLPDDYNNAIDGYAIGPTVGSCGTAIYWNVPVIVEDIHKDPLWASLSELATTAGIAACWSHPFATQGGSVLGALALYSAKPNSPTAEQFRALRAAAQLTGLAVVRGRAEDELRSANEIKGRFMANMSHEIRTPLNGILGMCELLSRLDLGPRACDFMDTIRHSSDHLLAVVNDILDFSKLESGEQVFESIDWKLADIATSSVEVVANQASEKGIKLIHELADDLPPRALLDPLRVKQILINLLTNAIKFTMEGAISLRVERRGTEIRFEVEDSGIGIPAERIQHIFESFAQVDGSTTRRFGGTGLGLAIAKRLAEGMGGRLEARSVLGQGSTFSLSLPLVVPSAIEHDGATSAKGRWPKANVSAMTEDQAPLATSKSVIPRRPTILVVDDNETNRRVTKLLLEDEGYRVLVAEDGLKGLERLQTEPVDLVLLDFHMPGLDGHETARRMRQLPTERQLHIVGLTAGTLSRSDEGNFLEAGADEVLFKPIQVTRLLASIGRRVPMTSREQSEPTELELAHRGFFGLAEAAALPPVSDGAVADNEAPRDPNS